LSLGNGISYAYRDLVHLHDPSKWITLEMKGFITLIQGLDLHYELQVKMSLDRCGRARLKLSVNGSDLHDFVDEYLKKPISHITEHGVDLHGFFIKIYGSQDDPSIELRKSEGETLLYRIKFEELIDEHICFCPVLRGEVGYEVSRPSRPLMERILKIIVERPELKDAWNKLLSEILDYDSKVDISWMEGNRLRLSNVATESNVALEAFSLAQLLYVMPLALAVRPRSTILIEEPEIHLHPRAQAKLIESLVKVAKERDLQLILTTHSEHVLFRLLTLVREGILPSEELKIYYFERNRLKPPEVFIDELNVNERGELDKGLKGFFEAELDEFSRFIKAKSGN
jgi:hypothetical protein